MVLEDKADVLITKVGEGAFVEAERILSVETDGARSGRLAG